MTDIAVNPFPQLRLLTVAEQARGQQRALRVLQPVMANSGKPAPAAPAPAGMVGRPRLVDGVTLYRLKKKNIYVTPKDRQVWIPDVDDNVSAEWSVMVMGDSLVELKHCTKPLMGIHADLIYLSLEAVHEAVMWSNHDSLEGEWVLVV
jgi:hypothetical protein